MKKLYPIVVDASEVAEGKAYGIEFPDIPGCFSAADEYSQILDNAREAALLHLSESGEIPEPDPSIFAKAQAHQHLLMVVDVDVSAIAGPAKRINITVPEVALTIIDSAAKARNKSRSEFLTEAALKAV